MDPRNWDVLAARAEYRAAALSRTPQDRWVPAAGGDETPFLRQGRWTLYVWNPALQKHGYLDMSTDIVHDEFVW